LADVLFASGFYWVENIFYLLPVLDVFFFPKALLADRYVLLFGSVYVFQGFSWRYVRRFTKLLTAQRDIFPSIHSFAHRVYKVLIFISSRRNWDSPTPSPSGDVVF
jgi:hypothetical protein